MTEKKEIWKDVPGYENYYQASNLGRVRSLDRTITNNNGVKKVYKGKVLKDSISSGYRQLILYKNRKGRGFKNSQLVAMAFLGHKPNGHKLVIDHINGDKIDDTVGNLRIVTQRANASICFRSDRKELNYESVGVRRYSITSKWRSDISYKGVQYRLGIFKDESKASKAYQAAFDKIERGTFNPIDYKPVFSSKYKGVYFHKLNNNWMAQITINGKLKYLGSFKTEIEAHNAYKLATHQL